ncbi:MAG: hypothetical protein K2X98_00200 [Alphaproteobacteria bacterium]|nr:hypothetical protein [Alphaproteobacteria bacterium]
MKKLICALNVLLFALFFSALHAADESHPEKKHESKKIIIHALTLRPDNTVIYPTQKDLKLLLGSDEKKADEKASKSVIPMLQTIVNASSQCFPLFDARKNMTLYMLIPENAPADKICISFYSSFYNMYRIQTEYYQIMHNIF